MPEVAMNTITRSAITHIEASIGVRKRPMVRLCATATPTSIA